MTEAIKQVWFVLREEPMYIIPVMLSCVWGLYLIYFSIYTFERLWSRILGATVMSLVIIFFSYGLLSPESTYKDIQQGKENISFALKNCRVSAFEAQQAGLFGTTKDAWSCPDGITRYLPVKYRPEGSSSVNKVH